MPKDAIVEMLPRTLTELTDANVTAITIEPKYSAIEIYISADTTPPADLSKGISIPIGQMVISDITLAQLAPGLVPARVFAFSAVPNKVRVSHG